jgi:transcriptional regulator with XRE-family HTH domain
MSAEARAGNDPQHFRSLDLAHNLSSTERFLGKRGDAMSRQPLPVDVLVGRNIRICRLQRGLSQSELGRQIAVTFQQIQKYENGTNRVGAGRLSDIARVLGVPLVTLFEGRTPASRKGPVESAYSLLAHPHALRLTEAFHRIARTKARLAIVRLIEAVGQSRVRHSRSSRLVRDLHERVPRRREN